MEALISPTWTPSQGASPLAAPRDRAAAAAREAHAMTPALYLQVKAHLLEHDQDAARMIQWATAEIAVPRDPAALAREVIWIILCAGRTAQSARTIERKVHAALASGQPVVEVFGHRMRAAAIERAWSEQGADFQQLQLALVAGSEAVIQWARALPGVGEVTCYQLAKNFGLQVVKADLWLCRFAGIHPRDRIPPMGRFQRCQAMALEISAATGDPVPVIDSVLWLAGNKGLLQVEFSPHRITVREGMRRGFIY